MPEFTVFTAPKQMTKQQNCKWKPRGLWELLRMTRGPAGLTGPEDSYDPAQNISKDEQKGTFLLVSVSCLRGPSEGHRALPCQARPSSLQCHPAREDMSGGASPPVLAEVQAKEARRPFLASPHPPHTVMAHPGSRGWVECWQKECEDVVTKVQGTDQRPGLRGLSPIPWPPAIRAATRDLRTGTLSILTGTQKVSPWVGRVARA